MIFVLAGTLFQLVGTLVATWGLARTWREFADEGFWDEPERRLRTAAAWARDRGEAIARRLLRRQKRVVGTGVVVTGAGQVTARGRVGFAPLPEEPDAAIAALGQRTEQILSRLSDTQERVQDLESEIRGVAASLDHEVGRLEGRSRSSRPGPDRVEPTHRPGAAGR